jgi:imidazolonepropionase-like amidohydrolase
MDLLSVEFATLKAVKDAQEVMSNGFTTLRTLGAPGYLELAVRDAIQMKMFDGPRLLVSGQGITVTGGLFDNRAPWVNSTQQWGIKADGAVEMLKAIRFLVKMGVDVIKFEGGGASPNPYCPPEKSTMSFEEMEVIVKEANRQGRRTAVHTESTSSIIDASNAGATTLEHGVFMTEESAEIMAKNGSFLVPTVGIGIGRKKKVDKGELSDFPDFMIERIKTIINHTVKSVRMCHEMGVKIAMGSDMQFGTGIAKNAFEICCYVTHCGFTPMEALRSTTVVAAQALGLENEIGTLEKGKCADIIILNEDPLKDITTMKEESNFALVMSRGKIVKNTMH